MYADFRSNKVLYSYLKNLYSLPAPTVLPMFINVTRKRSTLVTTITRLQVMRSSACIYVPCHQVNAYINVISSPSGEINVSKVTFFHTVKKSFMELYKVGRLCNKSAPFLVLQFVVALLPFYFIF